MLPSFRKSISNCEENSVLIKTEDTCVYSTIVCANRIKYYVVLGLFILLNTMKAHCMDEGDTLESYQRHELTPEQIEAFLHNLSIFNDPERINKLITIFNDLLEGSEGNTGTLPQSEPRSLQSIFIALGLFIGATLLAYVIIRNWDNIKDLLFDMTSRVIELPRDTSPQAVLRLAWLLLQNPNTRFAFANAISRDFGLNRLEE